MAGLIKSNVQLGDSATATQNFTLSVPATPDGTVKLARGNAGATTQDIMTVDASGVVAFPQTPAPSALSTASGSAPSYSARAWVCFNGTGTPAVIASGNVSSITDVNTGRWTINFSTAMPNANYAVVLGISSTTNASPGANYGNSSLLPNNATTSFSFVSITTAGTYLDSENMSAAVFR